MVRSRFVRPDTVRLPLSDDDWILVRKRLTAGEQRACFEQMYRSGVDGKLRVQPLETGLAMIVAYLLDWSFTDDEGQMVPIRGVSKDELIATINALDPDTFTELKVAIETHEQTEAVTRAEEKKRRAGTPTDGATSPSPFAVTGASSGSAPSTQTITGSSSS